MYKQLRDNVFDGILTAALNEFITEELRLLPTDDELSVMYPTSEKQLKQYRKKAKQKQRKAPTLPVYLKRIAVIALAVISVTFGVLMTNEGVRAAIVKSFITWYDKYVEFDFSRYEEPEKEEEEETDPIAAIDALVIGYVPDGYVLSDSVEETGYRQYFYMTETGEYLVIDISTSNGSSIGLDHVNSDLEKLSLNGKDMYLSYNDTDQYGSIVFGNKMYMVSVSGLIAKDELIKIAENITAEQPQADAEAKTVDDFVIGYIPEGLELTSKTEAIGFREYIYMSENGDFLMVGIYESEGHSTLLDSENQEFEEITINGHNAYLMYNEVESTGSVVYGDASFSVSITGKVAKEELIKVAENITVEQPQADAEAKTVDDFVIGYIPEGFELTSETEDDSLREYVYMFENGDYIVVGIYKSQELSVLLDSENSEYEEITINGQKAYLMYNEAESTGTVVYGDASFAVGIRGICAKEELIKVAENITVKQPQADAEAKTVYDFVIGYIPEGFELSMETEDDYKHEYIYMADNGDYLMVGAYDSNSTSQAFDSENSEFEVISVNGREAYVMYNSDERDGSVIMGNSSYHICITGICAKEELIKVAENIK